MTRSARIKPPLLLALLSTFACSEVDPTDYEYDGGYDISQQKEALSSTYPNGDYCGDGTLGTIAGRLYRKNGGTYTEIQRCAYGCAVNQSRVNDECLLPGPWPSDTLTAIAKGASSTAPSSLATATPSPSWQTDAADGTWQDIRDAATSYQQWRSANPNAPVPSSLKSTMKSKIDSCTADGDRTQMVDRIIARYTGTVPNSAQSALNLIGARAQCKETVDRWVRSAGFTSRSYSDYLATGRVTKYSKIRPGNIAILNDTQHIAVVIDVRRSTSGVLQDITLAESNWGTGYACPKGSLPWLRGVMKTRTVRLADINVAGSGTYKIVEVR